MIEWMNPQKNEQRKAKKQNWSHLDFSRPTGQVTGSRPVNVAEGSDDFDPEETNAVIGSKLHERNNLFGVLVQPRTQVATIWDRFDLQHKITITNL